MKQLRILFRLLCLLLALLLCVTLAVACTDEPSKEEEGQQDPSEEQPVEDNRIDLSQYTLMRADMAGNDLRVAFGKMRSVIKEICGA